MLVTLPDKSCPIEENRIEERRVHPPAPKRRIMTVSHVSFTGTRAWAQGRPFAHLHLTLDRQRGRHGVSLFIVKEAELAFV